MPVMAGPTNGTLRCRAFRMPGVITPSASSPRTRGWSTGGLREIRETVSVLHDAGLRVVLDVVFNHTGESDLGGPTVSLRGLDNALYYRTRMACW